MKVVILAGGMGTRMGADTEARPKPMVEIGGRPLLWHIMRLFARQGFTEFIICLGHRGQVIKQYFADYMLHHSPVVSFHIPNQERRVWGDYFEDHWSVTCADTGLDVGTGTRLRRIKPLLGSEPFLLTYGDGLADIDIPFLIECHNASGKLATVTAVQPPGRFGALNIDDGRTVFSFREKPQAEGRINGGFFVCEPEVFKYIPEEDVMWEQAPLEGLAADGELYAYLHDGFWQCMDTQRDRDLLEELWRSGTAPWTMQIQEYGGDHGLQK